MSEWVDGFMSQVCVIQKQTLSLAVPDKLDYPVKPGNDKKRKNKWITQSSMPSGLTRGLENDRKSECHRRA